MQCGLWVLQIWVMILLFWGNMNSHQPDCEREDFAVITYSAWEHSAEAGAARGRQAEGELAGSPP